MNLNRYIDHTLLKPDAKKSDIEKICKEAIDNEFATVCINPCNIENAKEFLKNSNVGITTVIGFPLGASTTQTKVFETQDAIQKGATEIDMVINIGNVKNQEWNKILNEMIEIKNAAKNNIVKVILENCLLTKEEIVKCCNLAIEAKLDFVKTSTGFSTGGATFGDVELMKKTVENKILIKAAGGVRTYDDAIKMIELGALRLGTSGGVSIVNGQKNDKEY
ncbi:deoxyribose-phosphate aldolase [Spiroplasma gladiatoris]|uniref:Deoxyribose-phosphate aldolase n=1 Tax=Spiroplasma gladiatoris TaxID=2143 RepID=A0A4P7AGX0_9MOLU|nr:deoxyribose-phosphate aldolase [Spiroplasma gladiatoris]QBQ07674.1 deoxyribose-phosphate aldolase [Spiroplasma gladiatoris]